MGVQSFADGSSRVERRDQIRAMQRELALGRAKWPARLTLVHPSELPPWKGDNPPLVVMRSKDFLVQIFDERPRGGLYRLSVSRTHIDSTGEWLDGITWDQLQRVKTEAGFGDHEAVEIYPREGNVVNVSNMRHLWLLERPMPFSWGNDT